jgi:hypothetical protein
VSTEGGFNLWRATTPTEEPEWWESSEYEWAIRDDGYYLDRTADRRFKEMALEHLKSDPVSYLRMGISRLIWTWSYFCGSRHFLDNPLVFGMFRLVQFGILSFAVVGLFAMDRAKAVYFLVPIAGMSCILLFTMSTARFILPAMPFVLVVSGQGLWLAFERLLKVSRA